MDSEIPAPVSMFHVSAADGYALTVRRYGNPDGPRLILTHGNGFAIDAYFPFWSLLAEHCDCFVHDIRNHGWNPVDDDPLRHNIPFFVDDSKRIARDIERRFRMAPTVGVYHSLSTITALHQANAGHTFAALVLFDPPLYPPGGLPVHLQGIGTYMGARSRKRRTRFESVSEFADSLRGNEAFARMSPAGLELFARATLRAVSEGGGFELCCPAHYEAQIFEHMFSWAMTVDFADIRCPVKAIGSDPTVPNSFLPSTDLGVLTGIDYDFVPETSHLLQLEKPEICAGLTMDFLNGRRLAGARKPQPTAADRPREAKSGHRPDREGVQAGNARAPGKRRARRPRQRCTPKETGPAAGAPPNAPSRCTRRCGSQNGRCGRPRRRGEGA